MTAAPDLTPRAPAARRAPLGPAGVFGPLSPTHLGSTALVLAVAVSFVLRERSRPAGPQPGDHAWWHGTGPASPTPSVGPGLALALCTAAFYLLLPTLVVAGRAAHRWAVRSDGRHALPARAAFTVTAALAAALVSAPLGLLVGPAAGTAPDRVLNSLGPCVIATVLLQFALGVPWPGDPDNPRGKRKETRHVPAS
ncbi:hypothetical protein ACF09C_00235 [Streptomyces sp. NPDC014870]|uniref:hypothetical protein n=1 Tax=Streptomyces sp. NPDC014870 TaxID=3364925 RepID=UPI0036F5E893